MKQFGLLFLFALFVAQGAAQSTNENFPTPVSQNEISGEIAARDIGDARLTRHFYTFFADNGDVSLQIETANFDGDIDLFEKNTLRPLAKITVLAETAPSKTSRVIYFRKREQVILRIEGRSLTDDASSYRLIFSGSFVAAADLPSPEVEPKVADKPNAEAVQARVNSAGTIIDTSPPEPEPTTLKIKPTKAPTVAKRRPSRGSKAAVSAVQPATAPPESSEITEDAPETAVATAKENLAEESLSATKIPKLKSKPSATRKNSSVRTSANKKNIAKKPAASAETVSPEPDPLADVRLVILLKNGDRVERAMSEVFNVSVDKGRITVITKGGKIERFDLLDVQKMTIE